MDRTLTAARLEELATLRDKIAAISADYDAEIAEIERQKAVALGSLPDEAADLEKVIKDVVSKWGRTFVGSRLQAVFSNRRSADLDGLERDGLGRYIRYSKSVSIRKVGGSK